MFAMLVGILVSLPFALLSNFVFVPIMALLFPFFLLAMGLGELGLPVEEFGLMIENWILSLA